MNMDMNVEIQSLYNFSEIAILVGNIYTVDVYCLVYKKPKLTLFQKTDWLFLLVPYQYIFEANTLRMTLKKIENFNPIYDLEY